jgi:spore germination protein YaaH
VKLIAWAYVSYGSSKSDVPLTDPKTRRAMIAEALWLVHDCGFDGVQWDVEPCADGDAGFLALMRETRAALPPDKLLSTATPMWAPAVLQQTGWSEAYFAQVAATCDQMAVMCYDSGYLTPRSYVWLVRQQAIHVTHAAGQGNPQCRVLLGVPTYGAGFFSHNPRAENLTMALRGVREGLADPGADLSVFAGIAPFADYTTSAQDWQTYATLWPNQDPPGRMSK